MRRKALSTALSSRPVSKRQAEPRTRRPLPTFSREAAPVGLRFIDELLADAQALKPTSPSDAMVSFTPSEVMLPPPRLEAIYLSLLREASASKLLDVSSDPHLLQQLSSLDHNPSTGGIDAPPHSLRARFADAAVAAVMPDDPAVGGYVGHTSPTPPSTARTSTVGVRATAAELLQSQSLWSRGRTKPHTPTQPAEPAPSGPLAGDTFVKLAACHLLVGAAADAAAGDAEALAEISGVVERFVASVRSGGVGYSAAYDYVRYLAASGAPRGAFAMAVDAVADRMERDYSDICRGGGHDGIDLFYREVGMYIMMPLLQTASTCAYHNRTLLDLCSRYVVRYAPTFSPTEGAYCALWISQQAALSIPSPQAVSIAFSTDSVFADPRNSSPTSVAHSASKAAVAGAHRAVHAVLTTLSWAGPATYSNLPPTTLAALWHAVCAFEVSPLHARWRQDAPEGQALHAALYNGWVVTEFDATELSRTTQQQHQAASMPPAESTAKRRYSWNPKDPVYRLSTDSIRFKLQVAKALPAAVAAASEKAPRSVEVGALSMGGPLVDAAAVATIKVGVSVKSNTGPPVVVFAFHCVDDLAMPHTPYPARARRPSPFPFPDLPADPHTPAVASHLPWNAVGRSHLCAVPIDIVSTFASTRKAEVVTVYRSEVEGLQNEEVADLLAWKIGDAIDNSTADTLGPSIASGFHRAL